MPRKELIWSSSLHERHEERVDHENGGGWRFDSPGALPRDAIIEFDALVGKVAAQGNRWAILEHFKRYFAGACGSTANRSSSESWAEADLNNLIWQAADNAPLFIEAFYEGCEALRGDDFTLPEVGRINRILANHQAGFEIRLPACQSAS